MDVVCFERESSDVPNQNNIERNYCDLEGNSSAGGGGIIVYMCTTCICDERLSRAASRLGNVSQVPEQLPTPPSDVPPPYIVVSPFEGELFDAAHKAKYRVLGPTAILQLCERDEPPPLNARPLYTLAMRGAVICFTGFRKKDELTYLITLIHYMGGSIRKDMSAKVTHLIANSSGGDKYRYACAFRLPVLARTWVDACWRRRDDTSCIATDPQLMSEHRLRVFMGARVCFVGFTVEETQHMKDVLVNNGGEPCSMDDPECTHIVMANGETFGQSLFHTSHQTPSNNTSSPNSLSQITKKPSLYRRLSARLSGGRCSFKDKIDNNTEKHERILKARNDPTNTKETHSDKKMDESIENKENNTHLKYSSSSIESLSNDAKITNIDNRVRSLFDIENSIDGIELLLPSLSGASELQKSTTTLSSAKKRSRQSIESNIQISEVTEAVTPDKESDWKSPFKRLKIKDSFKFKNRPTIFKREKKTDTTKSSPDKSVMNETKSSMSPACDDDTASVCSMNTSKQSGFFDLSFASIKSSKAKSASKLRRSVKSFTASFRSERKKKYKTKQDFQVAEELTIVSTPKRCYSKIDLDISPVEGVEKEPQSPDMADNFPEWVFKTPLSRAAPSTPKPSPIPDRSQPGAALLALLCDGYPLSVVDEHSSCMPTMPDGCRAHLVRAEWFWASVQNEEAQDEKDYVFKDQQAVASETSRSVSESPSASPRVLRKRKLRGTSSALNKRRSSVSDAVLLSLSSNLLDSTPSPDTNQIIEESEVTDNVVRKLMSPRQQVFMELLQTECNYVNILQTIVTLFKQPLEEMIENPEEENKSPPLLNNTELKNIFGNLQPIYELHRRMLEQLHYVSAHWTEETSIGKLILDFKEDMLKAYPPFINFFENTKDMLLLCDRDNPRFHAFLKICQSRPECGRQTLQELLIRPVQRLPSISLLLDDILKHTPKWNADHLALGAALNGVKEVMTHINEDKRKTEGQLQMFELYNEIDQCPAQLISSHRSFVARCEVVELSKELSGKGDHLVLFLFTDVLEVCKKRSKVFNNKSPTGGVGGAVSVLRGGSKMYRHVQLMPLTTVKRVVNIRETDDCHNVFVLMCRSNEELKERLYSFMINDDTVDKEHFLRQLCRQMANTVCKADADKFLVCLDSHQLEIDTSDLALGTLSKAFKFATRTRLKLEMLATVGWRDSAPLINSWVGRAFSFNKTPSKLKRAVSSMISPFGSTANLTPASQLAQMRLASCNNINELGTNMQSSSGPGLVAPLSVQPQRKAATVSQSSTQQPPR